MGQLDPIAIGSIFTEATALWNQLENALGIGAGRREADIVTPVQNKVQQQVIAPVYAFVDSVKSGQLTPTCTQVQQEQQLFLQGEQQWLNFLHNTRWQDGRAAQQAEATLAPYFAGGKTNLAALVNQFCQGGAGIVVSVGTTISNLLTTPTGGTNWPVVAGIGLVAYFALRRK